MKYNAKPRKYRLGNAEENWDEEIGGGFGGNLENFIRTFTYSFVFCCIEIFRDI